MAETTNNALANSCLVTTVAGSSTPISRCRRKLVIGNWKMHGNLDLCLEAVSVLADVVQPEVDLVLCPPAPYLGEIRRLMRTTRLQMSAQNVAELAKGERTGEWSAAMLAEIGCHYVIVGHSERRQHHGECDALTAAKAQACVAAGVIPVVCIGENQEERDSGLTESVLASQLDTLLATTGWRYAVVAYEPVWAIGTGNAATPAVAQSVHAFIRGYLAQVDATAASRMRLVYGGSVSPQNAAALFAMPDVDGALIGRASLAPQSLSQIYSAALQAQAGCL
ncbi:MULTISPECIES: triose-phosphate isomerase [Silvimonas]|uniref:triose-phosphate isomerase n=1 Tax=Silvimonas TaxID=300264 RepID=UPI0024B3B65D|nr:MULTISPECIES: triose-phosphate isomerase [Silvimonas]MDR3428970.1 triose-phosphate isomerase [Silvimonas sp.]